MADPRDIQGAASEQGPPQTPQQWADMLRFFVTREPAVYRTVFAAEMPLVPGTTTPRLICPVTDNPETSFFVVSLQHHPDDPPETRARFIVNLEGVSKEPDRRNYVLAHGKVSYPRYEAEIPIARARRYPITVDAFAVGPDDGPRSRLIVTVFEMRRVRYAEG